MIKHMSTIVTACLLFIYMKTLTVLRVRTDSMPIADATGSPCSRQIGYAAVNENVPDGHHETGTRERPGTLERWKLPADAGLMAPIGFVYLSVIGPAHQIVGGNVIVVCKLYHHGK